MARVTKAELEQQVKELNEKCNEYIKQLIKQDSEIARLKELHDNNYSESTLYIQQKKKIEDLELEIKCHKDTINTKKNTIKILQTELNQVETIKKDLVYGYKTEIKDLKNEIKILNEKIKHKHNERGAGRKERFTKQEKASIKMYRLQGKTMKEIAEMFNCSIGLIHKLINK